MHITELSIDQYINIGLPWWLSCKESACNVGDLGLILDWEDLKKEKATHSSILTWVTKSQTGLSDFHFHIGYMCVCVCVGVCVCVCVGVLRESSGGREKFSMSSANQGGEDLSPILGHGGGP